MMALVRLAALFGDQQGKAVVQTFGDLIDVYVVQVSEGLATELRKEWAAWGDASGAPRTAETQRGLF